MLATAAITQRSGSFLIFILILKAPIPQKWSKTLKQFIGNLPMNRLSVFDHFVILVLKGLKEKHALYFYKITLTLNLTMK